MNDNHIIITTWYRLTHTKQGSTSAQLTFRRYLVKVTARDRLYYSSS